LSYGTTDEIGWQPAENPVHVNDFQATLLALFGMDHEKLTYPHAGSERRLTSITRQSRVISEWFA
jgi:hypothetical protein